MQIVLNRRLGDIPGFNHDVSRTDPDLLAYVQHLTNNPDKLEIVEIPDGVHYVIVEYVGGEYLHWSESPIHQV